MPDWQSEIEAHETRLRDAALAGDVAALDALLADDLVFTNQSGAVLTKQDDLDLHRSGTLKLESLAFSDYRLRPLGADHVLATLRADAAGHAGGQPFVAALRFTRVWRRHGAAWHVVAAHCTGIA